MCLLKGCSSSRCALRREPCGSRCAGKSREPENPHFSGQALDVLYMYWKPLHHLLMHTDNVSRHCTHSLTHTHTHTHTHRIHNYTRTNKLSEKTNMFSLTSPEIVCVCFTLWIQMTCHKTDLLWVEKVYEHLCS